MQAHASLFMMFVCVTCVSWQTVVHVTCVFVCVCVVYLIFWHHVCLPLYLTAPCLSSRSLILLRLLFPEDLLACVCVCWRSQSGSVAEPSGTPRRPKPSDKYLFHPKLRYPPSEEEQKGSYWAIMILKRELFVFTLLQPHREVRRECNRVGEVRQNVSWADGCCHRGLNLAVWSRCDSLCPNHKHSIMNMGVIMKEVLRSLQIGLEIQISSLALLLRSISFVASSNLFKMFWWWVAYFWS